jgi:hypothetical protein
MMEYMKDIFEMFMANLTPLLVGAATGYVAKAQNWLTKLMAKLAKFAK